MSAARACAWVHHVTHHVGTSGRCEFTANASHVAFLHKTEGVASSFAAQRGRSARRVRCGGRRHAQTCDETDAMSGRARFARRFRTLLSAVTHPALSGPAALWALIATLQQTGSMLCLGSQCRWGERNVKVRHPEPGHTASGRSVQPKMATPASEWSSGRRGGGRAWRFQTRSETRAQIMLGVCGGGGFVAVPDLP